MIELLQQAHDTFAIAPMLLPLLMAGAQLGTGITEGAKARKQERKADELNGQIMKEDPGVRRMADEMRQRRQYAESGQSSMMGYKRRMLEEQSRNANDNAVRAVGDTPGGTQQALLRGRMATQGGLAQAGAQTEALGAQLASMETAPIMDMADRRLSIDTNIADLANLRATQSRQNSNNMITGSLGILSGMEFGDQG